MERRCRLTTTEHITVEYLVTLARQLSAPDRIRLRVALTDIEEAEIRAAQRVKNQAAIANLDALFFTDSATAYDDDSWWPEFAAAMNTNRTSSRPLYPEIETTSDASHRT
jgi:hypothetical protein